MNAIHVRTLLRAGGGFGHIPLPPRINALYGAIVVNENHSNFFFQYNYRGIHRGYSQSRPLGLVAYVRGLYAPHPPAMIRLYTPFGVGIDPALYPPLSSLSCARRIPRTHFSKEP